MSTATFPVTPCAGDVRGFYQVLGVSRTATTSEIAKAKKTELRAWHPDHAAEHERDERLHRATLINEAAQTLLDPMRRTRYDSMEFRDPREDERRREQAAAQAEQQRRATAEQARRDQEAAAEAAARRRRAAAEQAQREAKEAAEHAQREADAAAEAERARVRLQRRRQAAHALWCLAALALLPHVAFQQLFIPVVNVSVNMFWTSTIVLALTLAHLWIGAATRVFAFQGDRSRIAANYLVVLQIVAVAVILLLAPAILLLIQLLKIAVFILGILFVFMILTS